MPKFSVYAIYTGSKYLGEVDAKNQEEARYMVESDMEEKYDTYVSLCHQCSREIELGDVEKILTYEIK